MKRICFVHSGRNDIIDGFIEEVHSDAIDVRLYIDGEEYSATFNKTAVIWNQQPYISRGRYIALRREHPKKIHLCTCVWTEKDIEEASKRAAEISELLKEVAELPPYYSRNP